jgi:hypothetical protein
MAGTNVGSYAVEKGDAATVEALAVSLRPL